MLDASEQDQLVPTDQREKLRSVLDQVSGLRAVDGHRCTGEHADTWQQGVAIWENVQDVLALLRQN